MWKKPLRLRAGEELRARVGAGASVASTVRPVGRDGGASTSTGPAPAEGEPREPGEVEAAAAEVASEADHPAVALAIPSLAAASVAAAALAAAILAAAAVSAAQPAAVLAIPPSLWHGLAQLSLDSAVGFSGKGARGGRYGSGGEQEGGAGGVPSTTLKPSTGWPPGAPG